VPPLVSRDARQNSDQSAAAAAAQRRSPPSLRGSGAPSSSDTFVNHGLRRWEEGRRQWLRGDGPRAPPKRRVPMVDDELIYDTIFSKPMGWHLPCPVPLAHMVELLEDEWSD